MLSDAELEMLSSGEGTKKNIHRILLGVVRIALCYVYYLVHIEYIYILYNMYIFIIVLNVTLIVVHEPCWPR